ncbi:hypothetical protein BGZ49_001587, partial [Haplosporangium sp. Z 27]
MTVPRGYEEKLYPDFFLESGGLGVVFCEVKTEHAEANDVMDDTVKLFCEIKLGLDMLLDSR